MDTINVRLDKQNNPIEIIKDTDTSLIRAFPSLDTIFDYVMDEQSGYLSEVVADLNCLHPEDVRELLLSENETLRYLGTHILSEILNIYDDYIDEDDGMELPVGIGDCLEIYQFILLDKKEKTKWLLLN